VVDEASVGERIVGAGALRGNVLHKLMEELLGDELSPTLKAVEGRAAMLVDQLLPFTEAPPSVLPEAAEMAATAFRTLALPELAPFLGRLVPEIPLWEARPPAYLAGRADAVVIDGDRIVLVVDWKSDVSPAPNSQAAHAGQLRDYLRVTGAQRGAIVYMSSGRVAWVEP
jgi:exodeoxyribonuclease-5/CRISPR-associated exonuclease Cas4